MCFFVEFQAPSPPWVMMEAVVKGDSDIWTSSRNVRSGVHGPSMGAQDRLMLMRWLGRTEMQNCPIKGKTVKHLANFHVSTCCRPAKVKVFFSMLSLSKCGHLAMAPALPQASAWFSSLWVFLSVCQWLPYLLWALEAFTTQARIAV